MLHVLSILKIIGIVLLVLILLVLFLIFALLFVPIRYQLAGGYNEENRNGEVCLSWFLHFVSLRFFYDLKEQKGGAQIRILGIDPRALSRFFRTFREKREKRSAAPGQHAESKEQKKAETGSAPRRDAGEEPKPDAGNAPEPDTGAQAKPETGNASKPDEGEEPKPDTGEKKEKGPQAETETAAGAQGIRREERETVKKKPRPSKKPRASLSARVRRFFEKQICHLRRICARIEKIREGQQFLPEIRQKIGRLLHHYRVRRGSGYLRYGTGDPAFTGELTGFLYILFPVSCKEIALEPQFTELMFQTELSIRGQIRLIYLLQTVLWAVFNRDLRQWIEAFTES